MKPTMFLQDKVLAGREIWSLSLNRNDLTFFPSLLRIAHERWLIHRHFLLLIIYMCALAIFFTYLGIFHFQSALISFHIFFTSVHVPACSSTLESASQDLSWIQH